MNENKSKSRENLVLKTTAKLAQVQDPIQYETYRNDLHCKSSRHSFIRLIEISR